MPSFSPFWKLHYKDIGNCCTFQPLEDSPVDNIDGNEHVDAFIDKQWMRDKKLKWIGTDRSGEAAWIDPQGMMYNLRDLKRNEKGEKYEQDGNKLELIDHSSIRQYSDEKIDHYKWELEVQKECGFCNDHKERPKPEEREKGEGGGGDTTVVDEDSWQSIAKGDISDYDMVTEVNDVTFTGYVTDTDMTTYTGNVAPTDIEGENYGQHWMPDSEEENPYIAPVPILPPVIMPTPKTEFRNPVLDTSNILDTSKVATPVQNPFQQKMAERQKAFEESAKNTGLNIPNERRKLHYLVQPNEDFDFFGPDPQTKQSTNVTKKNTYYDKNGNFLGYDENSKSDRAFIADFKNVDGTFKNAIDLGISNTELINSAAAVYGERTLTYTKFEEMYAIASTLEKNSTAYGALSSEAKSFTNTAAEKRTKTMVMAIGAVINAKTGGYDYSNGADGWDGEEQSKYSIDNDNFHVKMKTRRGSKTITLHMNTGGWRIKQEHFDEWKKNIGLSFVAPQEKYTPKVKSTDKWYQPNTIYYESTAVHGKTIFWKFNKNRIKKPK
jgi:hypothetical protein